MSRNGGYKIIDFSGFEFPTGTSRTADIHGLGDVYGVIESTNKRTIVSGLKVRSGSSPYMHEEFDDMEIHFMPSSGNMVGTVYAGNGSVQITVTSANSITVTRTV